MAALAPEWPSRGGRSAGTVGYDAARISPHPASRLAGEPRPEGGSPEATGAVPALLVEEYFDRLVAPGSARAIAETLGSPEKSVLTAFQSSHGLPVDFDKDWVHQAAIAFMLGRIRQPR